jgi:mRNA interferase MazF
LLHRIHVAAGGGWVVTEQIRTVSINRFRRYAAELSLTAEELRDVRRMLAQMLIA